MEVRSKKDIDIAAYASATVDAANVNTAATATANTEAIANAAAAALTVNAECLSEKLREFLKRKLEISRKKIKKLKKRRKIVKILIFSAAGISIVISVVLAGVASLMILPPIAIAILTIISGSLTGISVNFNLRSKKSRLTKELFTLSNLENKLDYVVSCNGELTEKEYNIIISEVRAFTI